MFDCNRIRTEANEQKKNNIHTKRKTNTQAKCARKSQRKATRCVRCNRSSSEMAKEQQTQKHTNQPSHQSATARMQFCIAQTHEHFLIGPLVFYSTFLTLPAANMHLMQICWLLFLTQSPLCVCASTCFGIYNTYNETAHTHYGPMCFMAASVCVCVLVLVIYHKCFRIE